MYKKYRVLLSYRHTEYNTEIALYEAVPQTLDKIIQYSFLDGFSSISFNREAEIFTIHFLI